MKNRASEFKKRRPHRSFRLTKRRDYKRSLRLPGYIKFTKYVIKSIMANKKTFGFLLGLFSVLGIVFVGLMSQEFMTSLKDILDETSGDLLSGGFGEIGKAGILLMSTFSSGGLAQSPSESQQIILCIMILFTWLCVVWILRNYLAGKKIKLRDALYNCGSPIISIFAVCVVMMIQLIPIFFGIIIYSSAVSTEFLAGLNGVEMMLFAAVELLLILLSIYWVTGSIFALIISTLQGMPPMRAIKIAGDMVVGRRLRIMFRFLWCVLFCIVFWCLIMIPVILLTGLLGSRIEVVNQIPIAQLFMLVTTGCILIFTASYVYLFYREVVNDDSQPA